MHQKPETLDDHIEAMLDARYVVKTDIANLIANDVMDSVPLYVNDCFDSADDLSERVIFAALNNKLLDAIISKRFVAWECLVHRQTMYFSFFLKDNTGLYHNIIIPSDLAVDGVPESMYRGMVNL